MDLFGRILEHFSHRKKRKLLAELRTLRHAEDDRLDDKKKREFDALIAELAASTVPDREAMAEARRKLARIDLGIKHPAMRDILDLLLVVGAVAFGIRGLFLQPFRIPTGSMQPTLYGIHYQYRDGSWQDKLPAPLQGLFFARRRAQAEVEQEGYLDPESLKEHDGAFSSDTSFAIGGKTYTLPGSGSKVVEYAELDPDKRYRRGESLADGFVALGDHLFVERLRLYLRPPKRGDVTVFNTENLAVNGRKLAELSGYYYIKRLAGLPGDTLRIKDNHLYIRPRGEKEFRPVEELDERFAKIFSGKGGYQGYWSGMGEIFPSPGEDYVVPDGHYFMLGDNSRFSLDSRFFGAVPRRNLVGRAFWVFWPFSRRWGIADTVPPLDLDTGSANRGSYRVMYRQ